MKQMALSTYRGSDTQILGLDGPRSSKCIIGISMEVHDVPVMVRASDNPDTVVVVSLVQTMRANCLATGELKKHTTTCLVKDNRYVN